uniref:Uncharacterized protein n=1 Tax=Cacopsylla melanoneura TaxID=428564 RepID=A0A8D9BP06_9HEMI
MTSTIYSGLSVRTKITHFLSLLMQSARARTSLTRASKSVTHLFATEAFTSVLVKIRSTISLFEGRNIMRGTLPMSKSYWLEKMVSPSDASWLTTLLSGSYKKSVSA